MQLEAHWQGFVEKLAVLLPMQYLFFREGKDHTLLGYILNSIEKTATKRVFLKTLPVPQRKQLFCITFILVETNKMPQLHTCLEVFTDNFTKFYTHFHIHTFLFTFKLRAKITLLRLQLVPILYIHARLLSGRRRKRVKTNVK